MGRPVNLRALMADLPPELRIAVAARIRDDKREMSVLFNAAIRIDGRTSGDEVMSAVSYAARQPLSSEQRRSAIETLVASGWVY